MEQRSYIGVGMALGVAIGSALGIALGNLALGVGPGIAVGLAIGLALDASRRRTPDKDSGRADGGAPLVDGGHDRSDPADGDGGSDGGGGD